MGLFSGHRIDIELLRDTPLFAGFDDKELNDVAKLAHEDPEFSIRIREGRIGFGY